MRKIEDIAKVMEQFKVYLQLEKGLSGNTKEAYCDDVSKLLRYANDEGRGIESVTREDLENFVCALKDIGIQPRSQARIISGIKSFYKFLRIEGYVEESPTRLLESPKIGRKLPTVLTVEEIDRMIAAIDLSKPEGPRNRAIIETMYGCGLRVSELVGLRMSQVFADDEYVIVTGKGDKQRFVPISRIALDEIAEYETGIPQPIDGEAWLRGYSFPEPSRRTIDEGDGVLYHQGPLRISRNTENGESAHFAALICHSFAGRRGKSQGHSADARPRKHHYD
jgi:site-specific recombinase XerD